MQYWQCKCGDIGGYGSMGPSPCSFCPKCKTTVETHRSMHKSEPRPHKMVPTSVTKAVDGGVLTGTLTRCMHCLQSKDEIQKLDQPMEQRE